MEIIKPMLGHRYDVSQRTPFVSINSIAVFSFFCYEH